MVQTNKSQTLFFFFFFKHITDVKRITQSYRIYKKTLLFHFFYNNNKKGFMVFLNKIYIFLNFIIEFKRNKIVLILN